MHYINLQTRSNHQFFFRSERSAQVFLIVLNWMIATGNTPIVESEQATLGDVECETAVSTPAVY